jgi:succinate-acetate transporter protein
VEFSWGVFWAVLAAIVVYRLLQRIGRKCKTVDWDRLANTVEIMVDLLFPFAFFVGTILTLYARFSEGSLHRWIFPK